MSHQISPPRSPSPSLSDFVREQSSGVESQEDVEDAPSTISAEGRTMTGAETMTRRTGSVNAQHAKIADRDIDVPSTVRTRREHVAANARDMGVDISSKEMRRAAMEEGVLRRTRVCSDCFIEGQYDKTYAPRATRCTIHHSNVIKTNNKGSAHRSRARKANTTEVFELPQQ